MERATAAENSDRIDTLQGLILEGIRLILSSEWLSTHGQSRQTALMWQQQPDYARYKEKLNGEGWLVNRQEGMLLQIKPGAPMQHAQYVLVSYYRLSARLGQPVRQQRMLRHLGIEMWINLQKIGWQRCTPPN